MNNNPVFIFAGPLYFCTSFFTTVTYSEILFLYNTAVK